MKQLKDKRGEGVWSLEEFGKYIIIILCFILLIAFLYKLFTGIQSNSAEEGCRASIVTLAALRDNLPDRLANKFPLQCITQKKKIPEKVPFRATESEVRNLAMEDISVLAAKCWWTFGNGQFQNVFSDTGGNDNVCHVCYTFTIKSDVKGLEEPLKIEDFLLYMSQHNYKPGLLMGGGATTGMSGTFTFIPPQPLIAETTRESRELTADRLMSGKRRLNAGYADYTGIYTGKDAMKIELMTALSSIREKGIEIAIITVPSLPVDDLEENVAARLLTEWQVGDPDLMNGYVFLFSLNDGKLQYAAGIGADAVITRGVLEKDDGPLEAFSAKIDNSATLSDPAVAVLALAQAVDTILADPQKVADILKAQRTYQAYIVGGMADPTVNNKYIDAKGTLFLSEGLIKDPQFVAGETYAIAYTSPKPTGSFSCSFFFPAIYAAKLAEGVAVTGFQKSSTICRPFTKDQKIPNGIAISEYNDLFKDGAVCNVVEK